MSKLKRLNRKLKLDRVNSSIMVHDKRKELALNMVKERAEHDREFAADLIKAVGDNLPTDIREIAEKTVGRGYTIVHSDKLKSLTCKTSEGCACVDVPKEDLLKALEVSSERQTENLKKAGLL